MPAISAADRAVFGAVNAALYAVRPRFVERFRRKCGYWPNLAAPSTLNELVQWRKLFDRNPDFPVFADKLAAKDWVAARCPDLAIPETVWIGSRPEDIPAALVAPGYVIKTNHGSNHNIFPTDAGPPRAEIERRLHGWLSRSLAAKGQWAYGGIERKVFVERRIVPRTGQLIDLDVRVNDGEASVVSFASAYKTPQARFAYFWPDGERIAAPNPRLATLPEDFTPPPALSRAVDIASFLGHGYDYLRIDFLLDGDELYLSELTLYPAGGYGPDDWLARLLYRRWFLALGRSWFLRTDHSGAHSTYAAALRRWHAARLPAIAAADASAVRQARQQQ